MYVGRCQVVQLPPFGDAVFSFEDTPGSPRMLTVVHGGGGSGKTTLLQVIASTRPGHTTVLPQRSRGPGSPGWASCEWWLDDDDGTRPHPLRLYSPNAQPDVTPEQLTVIRREHAHYDRKAKASPGYAFVSFSSARWFSRQPTSLHAPLRSVAHYDVRGTHPFDDGSQSDLTRDTKQALAYAAIGAALVPADQRQRHQWRHRAARPLDMRLLGTAMQETVDGLVQLGGFRYEGLDPVSLEPSFSRESGSWLTFDQLPGHVRHLVSLAALPIRTLWAAYPGGDPRMAQGLVVVDEIEVRQDPGIHERLVPTLRRAMPRVQWIVTTASAAVAGSVDAHELLALRRVPSEDTISIFVGSRARTH